MVRCIVSGATHPSVMALFFLGGGISKIHDVHTYSMYIGDYLPSATVKRGRGVGGKAIMKLLKLLKNGGLTIFVTLLENLVLANRLARCTSVRL